MWTKRGLYSLLQSSTLCDAEAVLFVHDYQREIFEFYILLNKRVSANNDIGIMNYE